MVKFIDTTFAGAHVWGIVDGNLWDLIAQGCDDFLFIKTEGNAREVWRRAYHEIRIFMNDDTKLFSDNDDIPYDVSNIPDFEDEELEPLEDEDWLI